MINGYPIYCEPIRKYTSEFWRQIVPPDATPFVLEQVNSRRTRETESIEYRGVAREGGVWWWWIAIGNLNSIITILTNFLFERWYIERRLKELPRP